MSALQILTGNFVAEEKMDLKAAAAIARVRRRLRI
jgi:hypothetical protein